MSLEFVPAVTTAARLQVTGGMFTATLASKTVTTFVGK
jgi:hypothetical protein